MGPSRASPVRSTIIPALGFALDLLGVAVFAVSGALAGIHRGLDLFGVAVLAAVTGIGGGVIRDLLSGVVPLLLRRDIYATAAIAGICTYLLLQSARLKRPWPFLIGIVAVVAVRLLAITFAWQLPAFARPPV